MNSWTARKSSNRRRAQTAPPQENDEPRGGIVTRVEFQKRLGSERCNVHIDGAYAFSLAADIAQSLREGQEVDATSVRALLERDAAERAYQRALQFLAPRPRSSSEVRRRLAEYGCDPNAVSAAIERLASSGLVDDSAFAAYWIGQRQTFHPRGPRALRSELYTKGVDRATIDAAIVTDEHEQVEAARRAAERKAVSLSALSEREFERSITAFLVRRGFDYSVTRDAVRRLWIDVHDENGASLASE